MSIFDIQDLRREILSYVYPKFIQPGMRVRITNFSKKFCKSTQVSQDYIEGILLSFAKQKCKVAVDRNKNGTIFKCFVHIPMHKIKVISSKLHPIPQTQHSHRELSLFFKDNL